MRVVNDDGGSLVIRRARKDYRCSGSQGLRRHAAGCPETIPAGSTYLECYWNTAGYQSGDRFTEECALALGPEWVAA